MIKNKKKLVIWLAVLIGAFIVLRILFIKFYMNAYDSSDTVAYVDGSIERGKNKINSLTQKAYYATPANVIKDRNTKKLRVGLVFEGLTDNDETNQKILNLIKKKNIPVSFALSAAEGQENKEFIEQAMDNGVDVISNGQNGKSNLKNKEMQELIENMFKSQKSLSSVTNNNISMFYVDNAFLTADFLRSASVSGYSNVVSADSDHLIDENSFKNKTDTKKFVSTLKGDCIVVVNLRGKIEEVKDESEISISKPAIDKQAFLDTDTNDKEEENIPILKQVNWLLNEFRDTKTKTIKISNFQNIEGIKLLKKYADDTQAELSPVYRYCLTDKNQVGLGISTIPKSEKLDKILSLLKKYSVQATFFVTTDEAKERKNDLKKIKDAGCTIGLVVTSNDVKKLTGSKAVDLLDEGVKYIGKATNQSPLLLLVETKENLDVICTASTQLNLRVVYPEENQKPKAGAFYLRKTLNEKTILELQNNVEQSGLELVDMENVIKSSGTLPALSFQELIAMRTKNNQAKTEAQKLVYTTENTVAFAFYNFSNSKTVKDAIQRLNKRDAKGTFFVTIDELMMYSREINDLLSKGYELGILYKETEDYPQTFNAVAGYLNSWKKYAKWRYNISSSVVLMPYDNVLEETKEAVNASGCKLIRNTYLVVKSGDKNIQLKDVSHTMKEIEKMRIMRGSFVCFNMGYYKNDLSSKQGNTIFGAVLDSFIDKHIDILAFRSPISKKIEEKSKFKIKTVSEVLNSPNKYTFCNKEQTDITLDKNILTNMKTDKEKFNYIKNHYIGTNSVNNKDKLPGFTQTEINRINKSGTFTKDKVLFLSFDDWGTEKSLNKLLYVLKKHNVKATFFVLTQHVEENPNLIRTIAEQGHQISCHTNKHLALANSKSENEEKMYSLSKKDAEKLRKDMVTSYNKLYRCVGNVKKDNKYALTSMFRPPTLAVSKIGMEQVFDIGFTYSISGEISTHDYEATSYKDMLKRLKNESIVNGKHIKVHNGSVIVMHMQENAKYTAQALDTMIPIWKSKGYSFARIDDYLGR